MEKSNTKDSPVGFFDSGVGGLSVLKQTVHLLPRENFIYFGDSKNAPYGTKSVEEVKRLTFAAVEFLIEKGAKAIVVACNTATSAAIEDLRNHYKHIPIIGIEPALKPAVEMRRRGKILIMATPMTLAEKKFSNLVKAYGKEADIEPLPCPGLVELIEKGIVSGREVNEFLREKLNNYIHNQVAAIVLGCTHYPFIKKELCNIFGKDVPIIDGSLGTAKQLRKLLMINDIMNESTEVGKIKVYNSLESENIIELSYKLLNM
jgi:glutamate racemase